MSKEDEVKVLSRLSRALDNLSQNSEAYNLKASVEKIIESKAKPTTEGYAEKEWELGEIEIPDLDDLFTW